MAPRVLEQYRSVSAGFNSMKVGYDVLDAKDEYEAMVHTLTLYAPKFFPVNPSDQPEMNKRLWVSEVTCDEVAAGARANPGQNVYRVEVQYSRRNVMPDVRISYQNVSQTVFESVPDAEQGVNEANAADLYPQQFSKDGTREGSANLPPEGINSQVGPGVQGSISGTNRDFAVGQVIVNWSPMTYLEAQAVGNTVDTWIRIDDKYLRMVHEMMNHVHGPYDKANDGTHPFLDMFNIGEMRLAGFDHDITNYLLEINTLNFTFDFRKNRDTIKVFDADLGEIEGHDYIWQRKRSGAAQISATKQWVGDAIVWFRKERIYPREDLNKLFANEVGSIIPRSLSNPSRYFTKLDFDKYPSYAIPDAPPQWPPPTIP